MFDIKEELKKLPQKPGVYIMKDSKDDIIYVGKAINLRNRVRQYFQNSANQTAKTKSMVPHIKEFEYIVTDSEMEALILECNLIKKHRPYYNIMLKDDKMYPYIKVTVNEDYPRIFVTRKYLKDKAKYYGPMTDVSAVRETIDTLYKLFPIRKCNRILPRDIGKERPCLNYHIGQCTAPCNDHISKEEYRKIIDDAMQFLEGKHETILKKMEQEMYEASENLDFEKAAMIRDKINSVNRIAQKQKMANSSMGDSDIIAFARANMEALVQVFFIRGGKMTGREHFLINYFDGTTRSEVITEFVKQFYSGTAFVPKEIVLQEDIVAEEKEVIENWLSDMKGSKVSFVVPQKGEKHKIVELAAKNAILTLEQFGEKIKREQQKTKGAIEEIKTAIMFDGEINRIESYDISNTQGFESVGSMVVFENGKPKRSDYRKFKIKTVIGANDYASMEEVLRRRFSHALKEYTKMEEEGHVNSEEGKFTKLPDLILMDGGKTQVSAAYNVLYEFGLNIPVCGMVKDDRHRTRGLLFNDNEIIMPTNSEGFKLVTRIQDEVHRFAIEYHRKLRDNKMVHSVLDDIKGIGATRRKALLRHFGDIESIKKAELDELQGVESMDKRSAEEVYNFFKSLN